MEACDVEINELKTALSAASVSLLALYFAP
jgi:hypothetical protein